MRFNLDGLDVFFPYDYIYREQYDYMLELKRALDDKGHVLLEMPTGTGKTVCLVSLITSYQFQYKQTGKLIYCTRTVPEMTKCMDEIKKVIAYRASCVGPEGEKVLALCLSSRRNMCVHDRVMEDGDRDTVDTECRKMTASWVRNRVLNRQPRGVSQHIRIELDNEESAAEADVHHELCEYYENYFSEGSNAEIPQGIYSLDDLRGFGKEKTWCPYFMARHLIHHASILVYNYQYMLDPKVANIVSKELEAESIVVFDEAHNIDNVCIEALSVTLDKRMMDAAQRSVSQLSTHVARLKTQNDDRLRREAQDLVRGLVANQQQQQQPRTTASAPSAGPGQRDNPADVQSRLTAAADAWLSNPILSRDLLDEAVPGNIRKAEHFLSFLRQIVQYLKRLFASNSNSGEDNPTAAASVSFASASAHNHSSSSSSGANALGSDDVYEKTPIAFLHHLQSETGVDRKSLKFTYLRLNMLLRTLEMTSLDDFAALSEVCNFTTLVATYLEGFAIVYEKHGHAQHAHLLAEPLLQLVCLDASIAIAPVFERFRSVIITSGTLSPLDLYPKLLNFRPVTKKSLPMSTFRNCLLPVIVSRGSDQTALSTRYETRLDDHVIRNYGQLLLSVVCSVPDGVCGFFTSYSYMEHVLRRWNDMGILTQILAHKLIFLETKDVVETTFALDNFRRANDCGRGAIFLSVARGKVAEGIDFDRHYGRCVVLFGIPYQYTLSHTLRARLRYLRDRYQIRDHDFLTFDALRQAAQCVGRVLRSKTDYGIVVLADQRYGKSDKRGRLPPWIQQFLLEQLVHLSADVAVDKLKYFLKEMGQEIETSALRSILLSSQEVKKLQQQQLIPGSIAPSLPSQPQPEQSIPTVKLEADAHGTGKRTLAEKQQQSVQGMTIAGAGREETEEDWEQMYDAEADAVLQSLDDKHINKRPRLHENAATNGGDSTPQSSAWQRLVKFYSSARTSSTAGGSVGNGTSNGAPTQDSFEILQRLLQHVRTPAAGPIGTFDGLQLLPRSVSETSFAQFHQQQHQQVSS